MWDEDELEIDNFVPRGTVVAKLAPAAMTTDPTLAGTEAPPERRTRAAKRAEKVTRKAARAFKGGFESESDFDGRF